MPNSPNKVKYGLKNVYYALLTEAADGTITYGTPKKLPGAISISLSASTARKVLAADDIEYWVAESVANYSGDLNLALISDEFRADCLGERSDAESGMKYETTEPVTARFALLFEFDGDSYATRHVLYNCSASKPQMASETIVPEDGPDPSKGTETITVTASGRKDKLLKARCGAGDSAYATWFDSVHVPSAFAA